MPPTHKRPGSASRPPPPPPPPPPLLGLSVDLLRAVLSAGLPASSLVAVEASCRALRWSGVPELAAADAVAAHLQSVRVARREAENWKTVLAVLEAVPPGSIAAGDCHTMVSLPGWGGQVWASGQGLAAGRPRAADTGDAAAVPAPRTADHHVIRLEPLEGAAAVAQCAAGADHSLLLLADGAVLSFGVSQNGQLGWDPRNLFAPLHRPEVELPPCCRRRLRGSLFSARVEPSAPVCHPIGVR